MTRDDVASGFPRVLAAEGISNFGSMLSRLAIAWLATLTLHATPLAMSALLVADVAAGAVGALLLGGWIDRSGKRAAMLACDGLRAALLGLLAVLTWRGVATMPVLVILAAASGVLNIGFDMARSAWVAQSVAPGELPRRNGQLSIAGSVSEALAFAFGGWLYQALGAALALAVDALSYVASALCLRGAREAVSERRSDTQNWSGWWAESVAGLKAIGVRPPLRALTSIEVLTAFGTSLAGTGYMIFVARDLALPPRPLGVVFALGALGSIAGAALAPRLGRALGAGRAMTLGLVLLALGASLVPMAPGQAHGAGWTALLLLAAQQFVGDAGHTVHDVHDRTLRQTAVPAALLARADAGIRSAGLVATLIGALTGGTLGTAFGTRPILWLSAGSFAAAAAVAALRLAPSARSSA